MANTTSVKIIQDGPRNATVRVTALLDTANLAASALITKAMFTNNDLNAPAFSGFRVDQIEFSVSAGLVAIAEWEATVDQMIGTFQDSNEVSWAPGQIPDKAAVGYTGSIKFRTLNWLATVQSFTITLYLVKLY